MRTLEIIERYTEESETSNLSCGCNISYLALKPGEKVLDLGCGGGSETLQAAALVGSGGFVWGLDLTPNMIKASQEQAVLAGVENASFIRSTMEQIPLAERSIDALMSNCAINHAANKLEVFRQIYRVLKFGGRFVVSDIMTNEPLPLFIKEDPGAIAACFGGAITVKEYEEILDLAGFWKIEILKERHYIKNDFEMLSRTFRGYKTKKHLLKGVTK